MVCLRLARAGWAVRTLPQNGYSALIWGAVKGHAPVVELLLRHKANADIQDKVSDPLQQHPRAYSQSPSAAMPQAKAHSSQLAPVSCVKGSRVRGGLCALPQHGKSALMHGAGAAPSTHTLHEPARVPFLMREMMTHCHTLTGWRNCTLLGEV